MSGIQLIGTKLLRHQGKMKRTSKMGTEKQELISKGYFAALLCVLRIHESVAAVVAGTPFCPSEDPACCVWCRSNHQSEHHGDSPGHLQERNTSWGLAQKTHKYPFEKQPLKLWVHFEQTSFFIQKRGVRLVHASSLADRNTMRFATWGVGRARNSNRITSRHSNELWSERQVQNVSERSTIGYLPSRVMQSRFCVLAMWVATSILRQISVLLNTCFMTMENLGSNVNFEIIGMASCKKAKRLKRLAAI